MSDMDMSRRGLLKTSLFGAAAAGMTGIAAAAEAKSSKKAPVYDAIVVGAGPAGLITAITAHDLGAKVVLLGRNEEVGARLAVRTAMPFTRWARFAAGVRVIRRSRVSKIRLKPSTP